MSARRARHGRAWALALGGSKAAGFDDWGLTPGKVAELTAELEDHLSCLEGDEGRGAGREARARLAKPSVRRALAAPHVADQVYATLNRLPTRREWIELATLLCWFGLIVLSDLGLGKAWGVYEAAAKQLGWGWWGRDYWNTLGASAGTWLTLGWLFQGVARAGFFATFFIALARAWRTGRGVWLARILQLKLIHTVLVVGAMFAVGERIIWTNYGGYYMPWPTWLIAPVISGVLVLAAAALWLMRRPRLVPFALFGVLLGVFLYAGGPGLERITEMEQPIVWKMETLADGTRVIRAETDARRIAERIAAIKQVLRDRLKPEDASRNRRRFTGAEPVWIPGTVLASDPEAGWLPPRNAPPPSGVRHKYVELDQTVLSRHLSVVGPIAVPGGGLGWLAVPIPFLGLIGLCGMVLVMGRRGFGEALAYTTLAGVAIVSTVLPFFFGQELSKVFNYSPTALITTPFPGFENCLAGATFEDTWMLILGLLFSAAVPWLLTGLFLRPPRVQLPSDESAIAQ
jgi:hypothetical protein